MSLFKIKHYKFHYTLLIFVLLITGLYGCTSNQSNATPETPITPEEPVNEIEPSPIEDLASMGPSLLSSISASQSDLTLVDPISITSATTISQPGNYVLSGDITGQIKIDSPDVKLFLSDVTITNYGKKVINSNYDLVIILMTDTQNTIINQNPQADSANAISIEGTLTINGDGSLTIESSKSGLKVDEIYYGLGGEVTISAADGHGINADSIIVVNQSITITDATKDGLHAETDDDILIDDPTFDLNRGYIYISGSSMISITSVYGDGFQADTFILIDDGIISIETIPTLEPATSNEGVYRLENGTYVRVGSDSVSNFNGYYQLSSSSKGMKVGEIDYEDGSDEVILTSNTNYALIINNGQISINSTDDALHVNSGNLLITDGNISINTSDDGITADYNVTITGGVINIYTSYEGIEGETINITGGSIQIKSSDDGINASSDSANSRLVCYINISGGQIIIEAGGDGIDSNGSLTINGGVVVILSLNASRGDGPLDADNGITINGGTVITLALSSNNQGQSTTSNQVSIRINESSVVSGIIEVKQGQEVIISFDPSIFREENVQYQYVVITSSLLTLDETYEITLGQMNYEVIITSLTTTIGNSSSRYAR